LPVEDLDVWKRSCRLSADIYKELADLKDYGFKDQITRSGLSVPSNIAESMERNSIKEKCRFLDFSKGSMAEMRTPPRWSLLTLTNLYWNGYRLYKQRSW